MKIVLPHADLNKKGSRGFEMTELIKKKAKSAWNYIRTFFKWLVISLFVGGVGGFVGALFHLSIDYVTKVRMGNSWVVFLLPLGGVVIVFLYKVSGMWENGGTNNVINSVKEKEKVPAKLAPLIFVSTVITHFLGGSSGREGAALQLGGSIGAQTARIFRQEHMNENIVIMCGMSSVFSALFGTPITAAVFAIEVISVGIMYYAGLVPCILSAMVAYGVAGMFGIKPVHFDISGIPVPGVLSVGKVMAVAALCAVVSIVFCVSMKGTAKLMKRVVKNDYLKAVLGGVVIIILTMLIGHGRYNGAGMETVSEAMKGNALWYDFIFKIIFTAITLAAGFKGGEIVPTFFVGATFGCAIGGLLGLDSGFAASLGLTALFCGVVNCPFAAFLLAVELFGGEGIIYYAVTAGISYMLSGYYGLYSSQKIVYSKLRAEYINIDAK